jgi:hypothetical protein
MSSVTRWVAAAMLAASGAAMAAPAYFKWEAVALPLESGAACADGSPARVFVNRTPLTTKTVVMFEGGGACWTKGSCKGVHNGGGVAANYMSDLNQMAALGLVTPFTARIDPLQAVQTQSWNIIYVPYCTGDVHSGDKFAVYTDGDPSTPPVTIYHRGARNAQALADWMAKNMPAPEHLFVTGFSAGGAGATNNYAVLRDTVKPKMATLLADSGPLMQATRGETPEQAPSILLHTKIRQAWGLDEPGGPIDKMKARFGDTVDADNMGSLTQALARAYPQDRLGFAVFLTDAVYSDFSYTSFYPEIAAAPDDATRLPLLLAKWQPEVKRWTDAMRPFANVGFYVPYHRDIIDSHCLTPATFLGTGIVNPRILSVNAFVDNLISRQGTLIKAYETAPASQTAGMLDQWLLSSLAKLFGL